MGLFGKRGVRSISARDLRRALDEGAVVVDVRTKEEWSAGHLPFARHIPLEQLISRAGELDSALLTVFVCRSGNRSRGATKALSDREYRAANLAGGMVACRRAELPVVRNDDSPGVVA